MKSIQTLGHSQNLHLIAGKVALPRFSAATCLRSIIGLCVLLTLTPTATAAVPDLTAAGVIAALKITPTYSNRPYSETYNLGPTGLRGWIYIDGNNSGQQGLITAPSLLANFSPTQTSSPLTTAGPSTRSRCSPAYDPAIQRAADFFSFYVNKGPIPYGEHEPYLDSNSSGHAPMVRLPMMAKSNMAVARPQMAPTSEPAATMQCAPPPAISSLMQSRCNGFI